MPAPGSSEAVAVPGLNDLVQSREERMIVDE
jgi:hypothetical protein